MAHCGNVLEGLEADLRRSSDHITQARRSSGEDGPDLPFAYSCMLRRGFFEADSTSNWRKKRGSGHHDPVKRGGISISL